jgi:catechol 2,3-dioxygenase-like lactoylglutathione lyase family enzyme
MERPSHAGLRHLALNVRDLAAMKRFYVDLLGFEVEWEPDAENVYLSSGLDNLALHHAENRVTSGGGSPNMLPSSGSPNMLPSSGSPNMLPSSGSPNMLPSSDSPLDHLGLIVRAADDVDRWAAFLEEQGVALVARPRTHRDGARSLYFRDPDGNAIQIIHHPPISDKT